MLFLFDSVFLELLQFLLTETSTESLSDQKRKPGDDVVGGSDGRGCAILVEQSSEIFLSRFRLLVLPLRNILQTFRTLMVPLSASFL